jgi:hypothetical protein
MSNPFVEIGSSIRLGGHEGKIWQEAEETLRSAHEAASRPSFHLLFGTP